MKAKWADKLLDALNDTGCSLARNVSAKTIILSFARRHGKKARQLV